MAALRCQCCANTPPRLIRPSSRCYKAFYEKVPDGKGGYAIDHAAFTFLFDRNGKYVAFFPPGTKPDRIATLLKHQL